MPLAFRKFTGMKMKYLFPTFLLAVSGLLITISCKPEEVVPESNEVTVEGKIIPSYGGTDLSIGEVYSLSNGVKFKITALEFYFEDVKLGETQMIGHSLFDWEERGTSWFTKKGEFSVGSALTYGIGVNSTANHADPTLAPTTSWLYATNANDMHWTWSSGYIFIKIEGKADTLVDANTNCNWSFSYHIAGDDFFTPNQSMTVSPSQVADKKYEVKLRFDFQEFFENQLRPINLATEYLTHSAAVEDELTEKIRSNFANAFSPY